jgi:hypothetical protein
MEVSFMLRPLYLRYPLYRRQGGLRAYLDTVATMRTVPAQVPADQVVPSHFPDRAILSVHLSEKTEIAIDVKEFHVGLTKYHAMKTCWRRGGIAPHILNLGTK